MRDKAAPFWLGWRRDLSAASVSSLESCQCVKFAFRRTECPANGTRIIHAPKYGLKGVVSEDAFARLSQGQHPDTGEELVQHLLGSCELNPITSCEFPQYGLIHGYSAKPFRILNHLVSIGLLNRQEIFADIDIGDSPVATRLDAKDFAAT